MMNYQVLKLLAIVSAMITIALLTGVMIFGGGYTKEILDNDAKVVGMFTLITDYFWLLILFFVWEQVKLELSELKSPIWVWERQSLDVYFKTRAYGLTVIYMFLALSNILSHIDAYGVPISTPISGIGLVQIVNALTVITTAVLLTTLIWKQANEKPN